MRKLPCIALFALTSLVSTSALAQPWGARLVRLFNKYGRVDVLTDKSGRIPVSAVLPSGVSASSVGLALFDDNTASMHMWPAQVIALGEAHPNIDIFVGPPLRTLLTNSARWSRVDELRETYPELDGAGVVVATIDTGVDVLHADLRKADGTTRIKWLLQTGIPSNGKHPELEKEYCESHGATCAIFNEDDINEAIAQGLTGGTYDGTGHGTHVTSIAAGNGGPSVNTKPRFIGTAPAADLIIGALDSFNDPDVSDTARFIFDRADEMSKPCVLNVSLGSDFGAHDGSDILDRRLSRRVGDDQPGHAIVAAAGNSGGLYIFDGNDTPWGIHTEAHVYPTADVRVPMYAPESKTGRGFLWITFRPGDDVSIGLEGPDGKMWIDPVSPGDDAGYEDGPNVAGVVNNRFRPDASLVPVTNGGVVVWSGEWAENSEFAIHLRGHGDAQLWVTSTGDLSLSTGLLFKRAIRQGTINVPADAPSLLAVGCTINRLTWPTVNGFGKAITLDAFGGDLAPELDGMCYFSSAGPTPDGLAKPELSAPGGFVAAAMASTADPRTTPGSIFDAGGCPDGIPNCYLVDEQHGISAGTSMSSPQVAGAVALLFQKTILDKKPQLTQAQVTAVLQAGARYPEGKVPNETQLGPGALDVMGAIRALGDEEDAFANPDPAKSWFVLSSGYARPDLSWPVWGTVELRNADGEVAHALDGTFLSLDVVGGVVLQPLRKIRHGLYRFSVTGEAGSSGKEMTIDVQYKGVSLGKKTISIGNDVWAGQGTIEAVGSCALASNAPGALPGPAAPSREWFVIALSGLSFGATRLRRRCRDDRKNKK